jgi:predicted site-specific integrase-resolvase
MGKKFFTKREVAAAAGVQYERIQEWVRSGRIEAPAGRSNGRPGWTASQMQKVVLFAAAAMRKTKPYGRRERRRAAGQS